MTTTTLPGARRLALATVAVLALAIAPLIALAPAAEAAPPCDYNNKVYCDGGDEPAWQWDTIDDIACVQIPGATLDANDKPDYSKVVGKVYYDGALVWDSTPKAPKPPKKPTPPKADPPKTAPKPTSNDTSTAAKPTTSKPKDAKPAAAEPTPTATATVAPVADEPDDLAVTGATGSGGAVAAGETSAGLNPGIFVLGGIVVAGAATLAVYALRRRRATTAA